MTHLAVTSWNDLQLGGINNIQIPGICEGQLEGRFFLSSAEVIVLCVTVTQLVRTAGKKMSERVLSLCILNAL